jgi:(R,R)-butanediol dehydrogenase/meso-butanediol dehydrogenase/diacetyl reductase
MRAIRFHQPFDLRLDDIPEPQPGPGEVALRVEWCGVCGSDLHHYRRGPNKARLALRSASVGYPAGPFVLGHEYSGIVTALGPQVSGLSAGDRVVVEPLLRDRTCAECQAGRYNLCPESAFIGLGTPGGGLATTTVVPAYTVHPVPAGVGAVEAALVEPFAVAWHAIDRAGDAVAEDVLIMGAGPVGLAVLACLKHRGSGRVVVSEPSPQRRAIAEQFGADVVLDPRTDDLYGKVGRLAAAFDCVGHPDLISFGLSAVRPGGSVVIVGLPPEQITVAAARLIYLEVSVTGSIAYASAFPAVIEAFSQGLNPTRLVSRTARLEDAPQLIAAMAAGEADEVKVLISPS